MEAARKMALFLGSQDHHQYLGLLLRATLPEARASGSPRKALATDCVLTLGLPVNEAAGSPSRDVSILVEREFPKATQRGECLKKDEAVMGW